MQSNNNPNTDNNYLLALLDQIEQSDVLTETQLNLEDYQPTTLINSNAQNNTNIPQPQDPVSPVYNAIINVVFPETWLEVVNQQDKAPEGPNVF